MAADRATPKAFVRGWLENSPFAEHLGISLESLGDGEAELQLPYDERLATMGDVIHGGAISSLVDTAAAAAAVSAADAETLAGGTTVDISLSLLAAARGTGLRARARVIRGGSPELLRGGRRRRGGKAGRQGPGDLPRLQQRRLAGSASGAAPADSGVEPVCTAQSHTRFDERVKYITVW